MKPVRLPRLFCLSPKCCGHELSIDHILDDIRRHPWDRMVGGPINPAARAAPRTMAIASRHREARRDRACQGRRISGSGGGRGRRISHDHLQLDDSVDKRGYGMRPVRLAPRSKYGA